MSTPLLQTLPPPHLDAHQRGYATDRLLPPPRTGSGLSNGYHHNIPTRPNSNLSNRQLPPPRPESGMSQGEYLRIHNQSRSGAEYNQNSGLPPANTHENLSRTNSTSSQHNRYLPPPLALTSRVPAPPADLMPPAPLDGQASSSDAGSRPRRRSQKGPVDWVAFYGGKVPAEIIEIHDDDSPAPPTTVQRLPPATTSSSAAQHVDKRRRINRVSNELPAYSTTNTPYSYSHAANSADSIQTTAATSTSSSSRIEAAQTGQKRKRVGGRINDADRQHEYSDGLGARGYLAEYGEYVPPPKQHRKQKEVAVPVVTEV